MTTTINNDWITLAEQRNGVTVQRKLAGLDTKISVDNLVEYCYVKYWERELYPNGEAIKTELKSYRLMDLDETINDVEGWRMDAKPVLSGFVQNLGNPYIIGPARQTLADVATLMLTAPDRYELHKDTRPKINL